MACKYGKLKSPAKGRRCRKAPRGRSSYRSRGRSTRRPRVGCKYGMLKSPVGGRRCKKAPRGASRRTSSYRRGRRPFNKGRRCVRKGTSFRTGKVVCRSYGSRSSWRKRRSSRQIYPGVAVTPRRFWLGTGR